MSIVTGGASGLGRATVERFVQQGARVVICDLPQSQGADVAKELGENCHFQPTDVSIHNTIRALYHLAIYQLYQYFGYRYMSYHSF